MNETVEAAYDRLPYPSGPHPYSHPGHFGMLAKLAGLDPTPLNRCRVLEVGGSDGGNLLPIAIDFPESEFVCLDISSVQIEMGRRHAKALGIKNIDWHAADVTKFDLSGLGKFDYIIAHGLFSWVNRQVQDQLLELYGQLLSDLGIGFISYNTFPGWHAHMALREMMLMHVDGIADDSERVQAVLDLVHQIATTTKDANTPIATVVRSFINSMQDFESVPVYITHEFLSHDNLPIYFSEFSKRSSQVGLQVFGDGNHHDKSIDLLSSKSRDWIERQSADPTVQNQYLDYLGLGAFRRSLLCREKIEVDWSFSPSKWKELYVSANIVNTDETNERWQTASGSSFSTSHPLAQAILAILSNAWPTSIQVAKLAESCRAPLEPVAQILQSLFDQQIVEARLAAHRCVNDVSQCPEASPFSRHQVAGGYVTTQRHGRMRMDDSEAKSLLPIVDGTQTVEAIATAAGIPLDDTMKHLEQMARHGLLVR